MLTGLFKDARFGPPSNQFMARALRAWAIDGEKTRSVAYSTDQENEVSKMYIPCQRTIHWPTQS